MADGCSKEVGIRFRAPRRQTLLYSCSVEAVRPDQRGGSPFGAVDALPRAPGFAAARGFRSRRAPLRRAHRRVGLGHRGTVRLVAPGPASSRILPMSRRSTVAAAARHARAFASPSSSRPGAAASAPSRRARFQLPHELLGPLLRLPLRLAVTDLARPPRASSAAVHCSPRGGTRPSCALRAGFDRNSLCGHHQLLGTGFGRFATGVNGPAGTPEPRPAHPYPGRHADATFQRRVDESLASTRRRRHHDVITSEALAALFSQQPSRTSPASSARRPSRTTTDQQLFRGPAPVGFAPGCACGGAAGRSRGHRGSRSMSADAGSRCASCRRPTRRYGPRLHAFALVRTRRSLTRSSTELFGARLTLLRTSTSTSRASLLTVSERDRARPRRARSPTVRQPGPPAPRFQLLSVLASHPGRAYTRRHCSSSRVGYRHEATHGRYDVHVTGSQARRTSPGEHNRLVTVRGVGPRLVPRRPLSDQPRRCGPRVASRMVYVSIGPSAADLYRTDLFRIEHMLDASPRHGLTWSAAGNTLRLEPAGDVHGLAPDVERELPVPITPPMTDPMDADTKAKIGDSDRLPPFARFD